MQIAQMQIAEKLMSVSQLHVEQAALLLGLVAFRLMYSNCIQIHTVIPISTPFPLFLKAYSIWIISYAMGDTSHRSSLK